MHIISGEEQTRMIGSAVTVPYANNTIQVELGELTRCKTAILIMRPGRTALISNNLNALTRMPLTWCAIYQARNF